jgi:hypothetical protein
LEYIVISEDLNNENVSIGLVSFSSTAKYLGLFLPVDPNDDSKVNPAVKMALFNLYSRGWTNFDGALDEALKFFREAPADRSQLMFFLSDGIPNISGDGDNEEIIVPMSNNHPSALSYNSELTVLDHFGVSRIAIGVGPKSDVRPGFGLDLIDNTPDPITSEGAQLVTTTDALMEVLLRNPVVGQVIEFEVKVNTIVDTNIGILDVVSGPVGFKYGEHIVSGLNPFFGEVNRVSVKVTVDFDGDPGTTADQHTLYVENVISGAMQ